MDPFVTGQLSDRDLSVGLSTLDQTLTIIVTLNVSYYEGMRPYVVNVHAKQT